MPRPRRPGPAPRPALHGALVLGAAVGAGFVALGLAQDAAPPAPPAPPAPTPVSTAASPWTLPADAPTGLPNILLVTLCSARADHFGPWGHPGAKTPTLDTLAAHGVVFENAWTSATYTLPSHATLFTGLYPRHAGVIRVEDTLAATLPSLPEILRLYGYRTVAYAPVASRASFRAGEGLERGFDTFLEGHSPGADDAFLDALAAADTPFFAVAHFKDAHPPYGIGKTNAGLDPRVLAWGDKSVGSSDEADAWFRAEMATDPALRAHVAALYDAALTRADANVGLLVDGLARRGLLADTLVVVAGDHGQALGEEGEIGHQGLLQPEVLHVPLVVRLPGDAEAGRRVTADVGLVDLAPTLLELAGAVLPAGIDGRSLVPLLHGDPLPDRGVLAQADVSSRTDAGGPREVLVLGDRWLRYTPTTGAWELRRKLDGAWTVDPAADAPTDLLAARAALSGDAAPTAARPVTDAERAALKKEGYW